MPDARETISKPVIPAGPALRAHRATAAGFTLVEMLVVVAIAAILAAFAVPNLSSFTRDAKLRTVSNNLAQSLYFARSEAVKRGQSVQVLSSSGDSTWSKFGWLVYVDEDGDSNVDPDEVLRDTAIDDSSSVDLSAGPTSVTFLPTGAANAAILFGLCMADENGTVPGPGRQIALARIGRITITEITCG